MSTATRIYLLRHGETEWNRERRIQGQLDSRLTVRGREQARANGERLAKLFDGHPAPRFVASPLGRCRETAALVCGALGVRPGDVEFDDRLKEHAYGAWEGCTKNECARLDPELYAAREADRWDVAAPGGENYSMVAARMQAWLADVEGETLVAISHGCAGRILRVVYAGLPRTAVSALSEAHDEIHLLEAGRIMTIPRADFEAVPGPATGKGVD